MLYPRTDIIEVSKITVNNDKKTFYFYVRYEGVNGDSDYKIEGKYNFTNNEVFFTSPKKGEKLKPYNTQFTCNCCSPEELDYDEVIVLYNKILKNK